MTMTEDDLILCTFRYCLGRMTYIVSDMTEYLEKKWDDIKEPYQEIIKREIKEALERNKAGMKCDWITWDIFLKKVDKEGKYAFKSERE